MSVKNAAEVILAFGSLTLGLAHARVVVKLAVVFVSFEAVLEDGFTAEQLLLQVALLLSPHDELSDGLIAPLLLDELLV